MSQSSHNQSPSSDPAIAGALLILILLPLASARSSPPDPEIRRGIPVDADPDARAGRRKLFYERLAARAEPDRRGVHARLPQYIDLFMRSIVRDPRLFAFHVQARAGDSPKLTLEGFIEYPEQHQSLLAFLHALGFNEIDDRIITAPAIAPGAAPLALVNRPRAFLHDRPTLPRETVSECTIGEPLFLISESQDGHLLCHAADGYVGYIRADDVLRVDPERFSDYRTGDRAVLLRSIDHAGLKLPVGAALKASTDGVILPDGTAIPVDPQHLRRITPDPRIDSIIDTAVKMAGTRYLWGGKTADGIDCSGLVQLAFRAHGIHLPRDSDQQAHVGALVATRWHRAGLRRGDTLFFLGRHGTITHTAIYLGDQKYIEAAGPDVRISSFDPNDSAYSEHNHRAFCFARRVLE